MSEFNVGDYVQCVRHDEDHYDGAFGTVIDQADPRIADPGEWPLVTPGGTTSPGNVWLYLDAPVKGKHTWQFSIPSLALVRPWSPPATPDEIERYLNA